jgi:hypothetical protein
MMERKINNPHPFFFPFWTIFLSNYGAARRASTSATARRLSSWGECWA